MKKAHSLLSDSVLDDIKSVGLHIEVARRRRKKTAKLVCESAGITPQTYKRLVNGDPGVSIGVIAAVLHALNLEDTLQAIADPATDKQGIALEVSRASKSGYGDDNGRLDTNF
ncbi:MAG: helix-turn-helix transcriptional regulator [Halopseudomonas sabulinigri]